MVVIHEDVALELKCGIVGGYVIAATRTGAHSTSIESSTVTAFLDYSMSPTQLYFILCIDCFKIFCIYKTYPTLLHHIECT